MIEWLLTDSNLLAATFYGVIGVIALFTIITVSLPYENEKHSKRYETIGDFCITATLFTPLIIIFLGLTIGFKSQIKYTSDSEWKTIYENDIDAEIILNLKTENGYLISNAIAG